MPFDLDLPDFVVSPLILQPLIQHMAHTHTALLYHLVFSTKHREPVLSQPAREVLFPYIGGVIERFGGKPLIINGVEDHVHILCTLRSTPDLAEVVRNIKAGSSSWYNKRPGARPVHWQEGYGAFTVSYSQCDRVYSYIRNQEEHHRKKTFAEEFEEFLVRHRIEYDPRFILD